MRAEVINLLIARSGPSDSIVLDDLSVFNWRGDCTKPNDSMFLRLPITESAEERQVVDTSKARTWALGPAN
jgi:hypothetical protein